MKNILITGGNSFLAKEFIEYFHNKYNLIITDRKTLDVTNKDNVNSFFKKNKVDYILHTAIKGGNRLRKDTFEDFVDNINMYHNLRDNSDKFKLMFNFASGAEFNRTQSIDNCVEEEIFASIPEDFYGCSKNLISRDITTRENIINIRLFGCFGKHENDTRFIKNAINKCKNNEDIIIDNKIMDFISAKDLCIIIEYFLNNKFIYKDINAVYNEKINLINITKMIKSLTNSKSSIIIAQADKNYFGSSIKLDSLNLKLDGLEKSIKNMVAYSDR